MRYVNHIAGGFPLLGAGLEKLNRFALELGAIRPPSEARSLLIRATRNCPWNRCEFCGTYGGQRFELRSVEEIKGDIDTARAIAEEIKATSWRMGYGGDPKEAAALIYNSGLVNPSVSNVALWLYFGGETAFLQDANSLIMRTPEMVETLGYLRERLPSIARVTTYGRSKTAAKKKVEELRQLREAGLSRVHIGLETGYDPLLEYMQKGVSAREHVIGGRNIKEAGLSLSEYVMPGLGGRKMSREHVRETAQVLNEIDPDYIRLRSLIVRRGSHLRSKWEDGDFEPLSEDEVVEEIGELISSLHCHSYVISDQMSNLLGDAQGKLPQDREKMLGVINEYLRAHPGERMRRRLKSRAAAYINVYGTLGELEAKVEEALRCLDSESPEAAQKVEEAILALKERFV
ncbi:MAG: radical SAM protein [Dehalococcoidia bacterium]